MPRWLFLICVTALALSVIGGVLIVLRSPGDPPRVDPAANGAATVPAAPVPQAGGSR